MSTTPQSQLSTPFTYHYNGTTSQCSAAYSTALPHPQMNKVVIFDWDDTLFPTSDFYRKLFGNEFDAKAIQLLSQNVLSIIKKSCLLYDPSNIFIVTNGTKGWILQSLKKIMIYCWQNKIENSFKEIFDLISRNCITTISARDLYSAQLPNQTMLWKYSTFNAIITAKNADTLISIGDSNDEYLASENLKKVYNNHQTQLLLHRLKLTEKPKISQMNEQFNLISKLLDILPEHNHEDVDIDYPKQRQQSLSNNKH